MLAVGRFCALFSLGLSFPPFFSFSLWNSESTIRSALYECLQVRISLDHWFGVAWHTYSTSDQWERLYLRMNSLILNYIWSLSVPLYVSAFCPETKRFLLLLIGSAQDTVPVFTGMMKTIQSEPWCWLPFAKYLAKLNKAVCLCCGVKIFFSWFTKFTCFRSSWCSSSPKPHHVDYNMPLLGLSRNRGRAWPVGFLC